jgi:hypothetical protein
MAVVLGSSGVTFSDSTSQSTSITDTGAFIGMQSYSQSGTYTWVNPGATTVVVKLVGGGGGSAGYSESGGGGGYSEAVINVSGVATVSVTVGGGGYGVGYYAGAGSGGTSSFGSYCSATGGGGANTYSTHSGGHGGVGSGGQVNLYGSSGSGHANGIGACPVGRGGESYFGGGGVQIRNHGYNGAQNDKIYVGSAGAGAPGKGTDGHGCYWPTTPNLGEPGCVIVYSYK